MLTSSTLNFCCDVTCELAIGAPIHRGSLNPIAYVLIDATRIAFGVPARGTR